MNFRRHHALSLPVPTASKVMECEGFSQEPRILGYTGRKGHERGFPRPILCAAEGDSLRSKERIQEMQGGIG